VGLFKKRIDISQCSIPEHIGIIMDGNGRWAKKRGLPRFLGHVQGGKTFRTITRYCSKLGVKYVTYYAFSTENWSRPQEEVDALMNQFNEYLDEILVDFNEYNMKLRFIGDMSRLSDELRDKIEKAMAITSDMTGITVNIAINYGGRQEITRAARALAVRCAAGEIKAEDIDEERLGQEMYTGDQPDPDLIIRPSGEQRLSNFLLWQCAYAEFWYSDVLWPDFSEKDLDAAIIDFNRRTRRFGGV
jgi:undecaprenyl diphosphate synthase